MKVLAKISIVLLSAAAVPAVYADAGPNNSVSNLPISPLLRGGLCLGDGCRPYGYYDLFGATQSVGGCGMGTGSPTPVRPYATSLNIDSFFGELYLPILDNLEAELAARGSRGPQFEASIGDFDVDEFFGEIELPIISGQNGNEYLGLWGAYRYSDYSDVGSATTPRAAASWGATDDLVIRGSYQRAMRAPNVSELFSAAVRDTSSYQPSPSNSPPPDPNDYKLGVVYTPDWAEGLDITLDYFEMEIKDAIDALGGSSQSGQCPQGNCDDIGDGWTWSDWTAGDRYASPRGGSGPAGSYSTQRGFVFGAITDPSTAGLNIGSSTSQYMLFPPPNSFGLFQFPGSYQGIEGFGADQGPIKGTFDSGFSANIDAIWEGWTPFSSAQGQSGGSSGGAFGLPTGEYGSMNFPTPVSGLPANISPFVTQQVNIGGTSWTSVTFPVQIEGRIVDVLVEIGVTGLENNSCRIVLAPTDPNYTRTGRPGGGSWGQKQDDQWAIKRVGYTDDENSAWNLIPETASPVVVAVIDTGLDWHHLDISHENIWRNEDEDPDNGIDDDNNGYVDDVIGWNFFARNNKPWDFDGHGTVVAGIIAATQNNDAGIAGINPHAKIMVLKGVNNFGTTRASYLAEAIVYAVNNGARIINLSVGGPNTSEMEQAAIDYAYDNGVLVIAASGNEGIELDDFGPGGNEHVLTIGATHVNDRAAGFSNFGDDVDLVAPGVDVLSLRARFTDVNYRPGSNDDEYELGANYVGDDKRYIHVSGTSFSTPIVAATASLLLSKNPEMSAAEVEEILLVTAEDIELPGKDKYAGHGMLDATAALSVDPDFFVTADITGVQLVQAENGELLYVNGTIDADQFKRAWMQIGPGENPVRWSFVGQKRKYPIRDGTLGKIPISEFADSEVWQVVINVEHKNGVVRSDTYPLKVK